MYDATTKQMRFGNKTDLYWCALARTAKSGMVPGCPAARAFLITQTVHPPAFPVPGPPPYACVSTAALKHLSHLFPVVWTGALPAGLTQPFINGLPDTTGSGWTTSVVASRDHLPAAFRQAVGPM